LYASVSGHGFGFRVRSKAASTEAAPDPIDARRGSVGSLLEAQQGEKMRSLLIASMVVAGVFVAGAARAEEAADVAKAQCGKCHEMDKKKKGPAWKDIAAKNKGKADAQATLAKFTLDPKGDHPEMKATPEQVNTVLKWVLAQ
jgi:cytochrome c